MKMPHKFEMNQFQYPLGDQGNLQFFKNQMAPLQLIVFKYLKSWKIFAPRMKSASLFVYTVIVKKDLTLY